MNLISMAIGIGRAEDEDTSLATGIKSHAKAIADATKQLTATEERLTVVANVHVGKHDVDDDVGHPLSANTNVMNDDITQQVQEQQQQHWHCNQQQSTRQAMQQQMGERGREGGPGEEREKGRKGERGKKEEGRKAEEEADKQVKQNVTDWTVVTRDRRQKKMIQIFVKVNGTKAMEVSLTDDKVDDVIRRIPNGEDMYVTMHGRVLKRTEKLKSCEVTDGCTIQVTSRLRGGGKQKDKKSRDEKRQVAGTQKTEQKFEEEAKNDEGPLVQKSDKEAMIRMMEENEASRKLIESMSEGSEVEMEEKMRFCLTQFQKLLGWSKEQMEQLERRIRRTVE